MHWTNNSCISKVPKLSPSVSSPTWLSRRRGWGWEGRAGAGRGRRMEPTFYFDLFSTCTCVPSIPDRQGSLLLGFCFCLETWCSVRRQTTPSSSPSACAPGDSKPSRPAPSLPNGPPALPVLTASHRGQSFGLLLSAVNPFLGDTAPLSFRLCPCPGLCSLPRLGVQQNHLH